MSPQIAKKQDSATSRSQADELTKAIHVFAEIETESSVAAAEELLLPQSRLVRIASHEWAVALVYLFLDVVSWMAISATISFLRQDAFQTTRFEFLLLEVIQLATIVQALYIIGGYDRNIDKRSLAYAAEHVLAIAAAAVISAMIIYSAATFDNTMHPSRAVLLLSFL